MSLHFLTAGECEIEASAPSNSQYEGAMVAQMFTIAKDPSEEITFFSDPPDNPTIGGSYTPEVRSSAGIPVLFSTTTTSVCSIVRSETSSVVHFLTPGTCTIGVGQYDIGAPENQAVEAKQSFTVSDQAIAIPRHVERPARGTTEPKVQTTPTKTKKTPTKKHQVLCTAKVSKCATLIISVYSGYSPITETPEQRAQEEARYPKGPPLEHVRLRIAKLGPDHKVLGAVITKDHKLRVLPGRYVIETPPKGPTKKEVTVRVREVLEVRLDVPVK
jgi:hypothetical protein